MSENQKSVFIVLVNYNGMKDTEECILSIQKNHYANAHVVVVENASNDASDIQNLERFPHTHVIVNSQNYGFAIANNIGIEYALLHKADYILLLNNDTVVEDSFIETMISVAEGQKLQVLTCNIKYYSDREMNWYAGGFFEWKNGYGVHYTDGRLNKLINQVNFITGCCIMCKAEIFAKYRLPTEYFMYFEDSDFCLQLLHNGIDLYYTPSTRIYHKVSASAGVESPFFVYYWNRNRIILLKKYKSFLGGAYFFLLAKLLVTRVVKSLLYCCKKDMARNSSMWKGIKDGLKYSQDTMK